MKRLLFFTIMVLGGTLLPPHALVAQTYYDFAFAEATNNYDKGLIRAVDPTTAVSYYMNSSEEHVIALSSLSTYIDADGQNQFTTKIRVIDLATMTNLYAQLVDDLPIGFVDVMSLNIYLSDNKFVLTF